jgi:hypothetical protein
MEEFKSHLQHTLPDGVVVGDVPCILSTDATATTGRVGIEKIGDTHHAMGLDHPFNRPVTVAFEKENDKPEFVQNDEGWHVNRLETLELVCCCNRRGVTILL